MLSVVIRNILMPKISLCWMPLCWVSLCWVSLCWASWRPESSTLSLAVEMVWKWGKTHLELKTLANLLFCWQVFFIDEFNLGLTKMYSYHARYFRILESHSVNLNRRHLAPNILELLHLKMLLPLYFWIRFPDWIRLFCTVFKLPF